MTIYEGHGLWVLGIYRHFSDCFPHAAMVTRGEYEPWWVWISLPSILARSVLILSRSRQPRHFPAFVSLFLSVPVEPRNGRT